MFINDILQPTHLLLVLVVALLVLGPKRLPEVSRSIGRSLHDFRGAINGERPDKADQLAGPEATTPAGAAADRPA
jgi:sec-independent protein translocase protein TatA